MLEFGIQGLPVVILRATGVKVGREVYSPPSVDRIWLWAYYNKIPLYPIFYLLKGDYSHKNGR